MDLFKSMLVGALVSTTVLAGCTGGSGRRNSGSLEELVDAQFIDAAVKQIGYTRASGTKGFTGADGWFKCIRGEEVIFDFEGVEIGRAACGNYTFVQDLISTVNSWSWQKSAAIIQSFGTEKRIRPMRLWNST